MTNTPARRGKWQDNTPQQPTVAILQPVSIPTTSSAGAGTGAAPNFVAVGFGVGVPTYSAPNGSLYSRFDGTHGAVTVLYVNTSGASTVGTTWTAID
jgi:hypothetical protein